MTKRIPVRQCAGCGEHKPKAELIRVVHNKEGRVFLDATGKAGGRGAYLCRSQSCLQTALKKKRLEHAFGVALPEEVVAGLEKEMEVFER